MVKKAKPNDYEPISDELSPSHALVQSAILLDYAAVHAIRCDDFEKLMMTAQAWAELSKAISNFGPDAHSEEIELTTETEILGFRSEEEREEYEDRAKRRKEAQSE